MIDSRRMNTLPLSLCSRCGQREDHFLHHSRYNEQGTWRVIDHAFDLQTIVYDVQNAGEDLMFRSLPRGEDR